MSSEVPEEGNLFERWARARKIAHTVYDEFSFQSIYALKQGNVTALLEGKPGEDPIARARKRVAQSKMMVSFLLFFVISAGALALTPLVRDNFALQILPVDYLTSVIAGELLLTFSLLWMTGLQLAPTLLGSRVFPTLTTLPLSRQELQRVGFLVFARTFDAPCLTAIIFLPLAIGLATGSWVAALVLVPAAMATVLIASTVSLITARFFVVRVSGARGGTRGSLALRWVYLLLWSLPSLAITAFVAFAAQLLELVSFWEAANPTTFRDLLLVFPFPFSYLAAVGVFPTQDNLGLLIDPVFWGAIALYLGASVFSAMWLRTAPLEMALASPHSSRARSAAGSEVRAGSPVRAILNKDLRIASRTPGYAFLILLPLLDAFILGLSSYVADPDPAAVERYALAAVTVAALLATFFGPAFFATEVLGFSYTRTLPISKRTLLLGKTSLIFIVYVLAALLVMSLVAFRLANPVPFVIFASAELPAVVAAAFLELGVLFHRAEKTGIPVVNLYSGAWWATLVVVPGLVVAGAPLLLYALGETYDRALAVPSMVVTALLLLGATATWALLGRRAMPVG